MANSSSTAKMKKLQITITTQDFIIETIDEKRTDINGLTIKEVIEELKKWYYKKGKLETVEK